MVMVMFRIKTEVGLGKGEGKACSLLLQVIRKKISAISIRIPLKFLNVDDFRRDYLYVFSDTAQHLAGMFGLPGEVARLDHRPHYTRTSI